MTTPTPKSYADNTGTYADKSGTYAETPQPPSEIVAQLRKADRLCRANLDVHDNVYARAADLIEQGDRLRERLAAVEAAVRPFVEWFVVLFKDEPDFVAIGELDLSPTVGQLRTLAALFAEAEAGGRDRPG